MAGIVAMHDARIAAVLDWPRQQAEFGWDGSWRDIYVFCTTVADWQLVLADVMTRDPAATFLRGREKMDHTQFTSLLGSAAGVASLFDPEARGTLSFHVSACELTCHFFSDDEIEFSFDPRQVSSTLLGELLAFMIEIGELTGKRVAMTRENRRDAQLFTYAARELRWHS